MVESHFSKVIIKSKEVLVLSISLILLKIKLKLTEISETSLHS